MNARIDPTLALVNITWNGQNGDLPDPVARDATDAQILAWVVESLRGGIPGIEAHPRLDVRDLRDFVVDRFPPSAQLPYHRLFVRPKTPFGAGLIRSPSEGNR